MTDRDIMQQALDALEKIAAYRPLTFAECSDAEAVIGIAEEAIPALRERLAQPEQEPKCGVIIEVFGKDWRLDYMSLPVGKHKLYTQQYTYTAQPQRKPLTDEEIDKIYETKVWDARRSFARAIEAAHGIKENT